MSTWEAAFAAACHFETVGDWPAALEGYRDLYHNGRSGDGAVVSRYGLALLHLGALQGAEAILTEALSMDRTTKTCGNDSRFCEAPRLHCRRPESQPQFRNSPAPAAFQARKTAATRLR